MIGFRAAPHMAVLQEENKPNQLAVHFASPLQQVYNLSPTSSSATDGPHAQQQNILGNVNTNVAPFNSLWNAAFATIEFYGIWCVLTYTSPQWGLVVCADRRS